MAIISVNKGDYYYNFDKPRANKSIFSTHTHELYELMYFVSGKASFIIEGTEYNAGSGDIFFTRPNELHSIIILTEGKYVRHFFQFSPKFVQSVYGTYNLLQQQQQRKAGSQNKIPAALVEKHDLGSFFSKVQDEITSMRPESEVLIQSYTVQLLVHINKLASELQRTQETGDYSDFESSGESDIKLRKIKDCIKSHVSENVSLDDIADEVFMSKFYLCRFFKEHAGMTPKQYAGLIRIHHARTLLAQGIPLSAVYEQCGFGDYSSFYRTFVKVSGITPGSFTKQINQPIDRGTGTKLPPPPAVMG